MAHGVTNIHQISHLTNSLDVSVHQFSMCHHLAFELLYLIQLGKIKEITVPHDLEYLPAPPIGKELGSW